MLQILSPRRYVFYGKLHKPDVARIALAHGDQFTLIVISGFAQLGKIRQICHHRLGGCHRFKQNSPSLASNCHRLAKNGAARGLRGFAKNFDGAPRSMWSRRIETLPGYCFEDKPSHGIFEAILLRGSDY
jgi:hypothetical protein